MKKIFKTSLMFAVLGLMVAACGKDNSTETGGNNGGGTTPVVEIDPVEVNFLSDGQAAATVRMKTANASATLTAILAEEAEENAIINIEIDRAWLATQSLELLPAAYYALEEDYIEIEEGETRGSVGIEFLYESMPLGKSFVLPLVIEPETEWVEAGTQTRVVFTVTRSANKDVEAICFYEVNDVNPLNAGEVLLEDGSPFFDYVVLFAYNINYNASEDRVYLHANPNCQALLDESDVYIQPLRQKGIKVIMGLLGNHDASGLAQLSDWGAKEFAKEVANAVKTYGMDGVNLDDEYSNAPNTSNKWFTNHSAAAGSRLCYELKKAMTEANCDNNIVSIFNWGSLYTMPSVDGVDPSEFIDQCVGNYGSRGTISGNMTNKWATGGSYECNYNGYATASAAKSIKDSGYGYIMYFNADPAKYRNYYGENGYFSQAAEGLYDQKCQPMKQWYKKIGEGEYDPKPYNW